MTINWRALAAAGLVMSMAFLTIHYMRERMVRTVNARRAIQPRSARRIDDTIQQEQRP